MRVFATSDVHIDYEINRRWLRELSDSEYQQDVLILAGDLTDNLSLLAESLEVLVKRFLQVLFVPGNHECWVIRDKFNTSFEKFHKVLEVCSQCGVSTDVYRRGELTIVPLFSWYDFSFGKPCEQLKTSWSDFFSCKWPDNYAASNINRYFLDMNRERLSTQNNFIISFSHFLPRIDILPGFIPDSFRYLHPVMGSKSLGEQLKILQPDVHVYGHSHVNWQVKLGGVHYMNNAFGYPSETTITRKALHCIYETRE